MLVSSGGLGREVSPMLRAATLPGSEFVIPLLFKAGLIGAGLLALQEVEPRKGDTAGANTRRGDR